MAIATQTGPDDWANQDDETIATALEILEEQAREIKKRR